MSDGDPRTEILRLEAKIEELTELIERCRKIILISKIAVAIGGIWLLALAIGLMRFDPVTNDRCDCNYNRGDRRFWVEYEYSQANCGCRRSCTQAVLQRAFIPAKAKGGAEIAAASIDHLHRYIELLFESAKRRGKEIS